MNMRLVYRIASSICLTALTMRRTLFQLIPTLFILQLLACTSTTRPKMTAADTRDGASDSQAIRTTLEEWYVAMQKIDTVGVLAPLTEQFLLLEDTLPLTGDELVARLQRGGTETKWTAEFSDFRTRFLGEVAWTTVKNHEDALMEDGTQCQADFLETIVFVRQGESWFIDRYHAAAVNRWSCE